jgi:hypothetical protein
MKHWPDLSFRDWLFVLVRVPPVLVGLLWERWFAPIDWEEFTK